MNKLTSFTLADLVLAPLAALHAADAVTTMKTYQLP
jgi:hypothetical protein